MRRVYVKPTVTIMHLRPEEKLATCDWPVGFMSTAGSCAYIWIDYEVDVFKVLCIEYYNGSVVPGS